MCVHDYDVPVGVAFFSALEAMASISAIPLSFSMPAAFSWALADCLAALTAAEAVLGGLADPPRLDLPPASSLLLGATTVRE